MSDSDDEPPEDYKKGGYHVVHIGDIYNSRYRVEQKLGWGHFSTVWFCTDMFAPIVGHHTLFLHLLRCTSPPCPSYFTRTNGNGVALKIIKSAPHYMEAARDEIVLLSQIANGDPDYSKASVHLIDSFEIEGPNGIRWPFSISLIEFLSSLRFFASVLAFLDMCMVFEALGSNLLALIKRYSFRGIPLPLTKYICRQILISLDFIHRELGMIHTDLKPENILLQWPIVFMKCKDGQRKDTQSALTVLCTFRI
jgi:serine/threonine-protein kinase SRPK3